MIHFFPNGGATFPIPSAAPRRLAAIHLVLAALGSFLNRRGELRAAKFRVQSADCQEFVVGSAFADLARVDYQYVVRLPDGGQPVRDV